jgi:acyl-[acyl-carrier-protein] desaturase
MSKIAKRMSYPFTGGQPALTAIERRTVPRREDIVAFYRTHERQSWSLSDLLDIRVEDIQVDNLQESDLYVVESAMLVESNNPDYVASLLDYFQADEHACDFIVMWAIEEWKHYYALRDYLAKVQTAMRMREDEAMAPDAGRLREMVEAALSDKVADVRESSQANWGAPAHYLPVQVVANTTLQEFVTAEFYRNHARQTREPVLARIETLLAKDEARHEMFYETKMRDILAERPELLPAALDALKEFGMPGEYLVDQYATRRAAMEQAAFPTPALRRSAFRRLFGKLERMVGHNNAKRVLTEGDYLAERDGTSPPRRPSSAAISRLITARVAG